MVNRVVPELIKHGKYLRPSLGIGFDENINDKLSEFLGKKGVFVLKVNRGSPAEKAGLKPARVSPDGAVTPGDIITAVEGTPVETVAKLMSRLDDFSIGSKVKLTVQRGASKTEVQVTLEAQR